MEFRCIAQITVAATAAAVIAAVPLRAQAPAAQAAVHVQDAFVQDALFHDTLVQDPLAPTRFALPHTRPSSIPGRSQLQSMPHPARTDHSYDSVADGRPWRSEDAVSLQDRGGWSALRVAKWTTAGLSAGAAVFGVLNNRRADDEYEQLEALCAEEASRCGERLPGGAYADAQVEAQYQEVRMLDRRARTGLIAGQIGFAASVVLFVLDLRNNDGPDNIPYDPRTIDITPARDGGMSLRVNLKP